MTIELTPENLLHAATSGSDASYFEQEDGTYVIPKVFYKNSEGKEVDYYFQSGRDEKGFRLISRIEDVVYEVEDDVEAELEDNEFMYEGGFLPGLGHFSMIDNGHLGDGHEAWALVEHESGRLFRISGWYSSWGESGWDHCSEVVPAEVKVVRYQDVKTGEVFDNPAVTV